MYNDLHREVAKGAPGEAIPPTFYQTIPSFSSYLDILIGLGPPLNSSNRNNTTSLLRFWWQSGLVKILSILAYHTRWLNVSSWFLENLIYFQRMTLLDVHSPTCHQSNFLAHNYCLFYDQE